MTFPTDFMRLDFKLTREEVAEAFESYWVRRKTGRNGRVTGFRNLPDGAVAVIIEDGHVKQPEPVKQGELV